MEEHKIKSKHKSKHENKHESKHKSKHKNIHKRDNTSGFFNEVGKLFGPDENCLTSDGKVYAVTVANNMMITLIATLIIVYCLNYFNLLEFVYTMPELFLCCIVFFTIWNCIAGYAEKGKVHYVSTNTSLFISIFLLPLVVKGPGFIINKFC